MSTLAGHPDWQSYAQWRSSALVDIAPNVLHGVNVASPAFLATNYQSLLVKATAVGAGLFLDMQTADDLSGGAGGWASQQAWNITNGHNSIDQLVTPLNRAVRFALQNTDGAAAGDYTLKVYGVNTPADPALSPLPTVPAWAGGFNLAAGASKSLFPDFQGYSRAQVFASTPAGTPAGVRVELWLLNANAARVALVWATANLAGNVNDNLTIPAEALELVMTNGTAGAVNGCNLALCQAY